MLAAVVMLLRIWLLVALGGALLPVPLMAGGQDLYEVRLLPGRGEAHVRFVPGDGAEAAEKSFQSGDDDRSFRVEPGNSYLFPACLWDRFAGSRRGPFKIRVTTRVDEAVLASGRRTDREIGPDDGFAITCFEGGPEQRGLGLYVITRKATPDGEFPAGPPWVEQFMNPVLESLESAFGPLPGDPPRVVVVDFPQALAKSFPGAVVLDRRLALRDDPPPAGRLAILAHEMAHLWWPNGMRVTGPGAGALQEGLAEYGSSQAVGDILGPAAEDLRWEALRDEYLAASEAMADAGATLLSEGTGAYGRAMRYARSAWVVRMLAARVGDEVFRKALRTFPDDGGGLTWSGLVDRAGQLAGCDLDAFHSGWIAGSGHPHPIIHDRQGDPLPRIENAGRGAGEFPVGVDCPGREPVAVEFVSLEAGEVRPWRRGFAPGCRLRIDPDGEFLLGPPGPPAPTGLTLGRAWGYPVVRAVAPGTAGDRAGLRPGDLIVAVGSQPLDEEDVGELLARLKNAPQTRLRVRRGGQELEAVFRP
jgi:hypothetical protein